MSDARRYLLMGGRRFAAIGERVRRALDAVAREWWSEPQRLQLIAVTALEDAEPSLRASRMRYVARDGEAWLGYLAPDFACVKLAEGWLGCEIAAPGPLIATLEREFCLALFTHLRGTGGCAVIVDDGSHIPPAAAQAGAGTTIVEIDIEGVPLTLIVPAQLWPDLLDIPAQPCARPLNQAASAVADTRIRLEARLPAVQMPLSEVSALAPGDFIDLQLDLSGSVRIVSREMSLRLDAVLGKQDGQRAIQLRTVSGTTA